VGVSVAAAWRVLAYKCPTLVALALSFHTFCDFITPIFELSMESKGTCAIVIRLFSVLKFLVRETTTDRRLRPMRRHEYITAAPQRRSVRRKHGGVGGKSQRIGPLLSKEIIYQQIIVEGGVTLQHTMSGDVQQMMLNYEGQKVWARVKGTTELEGVGKMFAVFIRKEGFYVHERVLQDMKVRGVDAFSGC
jgi:hypothetical protein